jgi:hypothetical protein
MSPTPRQKHPAHALVEALKGRTVVDASCDAEGVDAVRLRLDDGTVILIDSELDRDSAPLAKTLDRPPWPRLVVRIGGDDLWPHGARDGLGSIGERPDMSDEERTERLNALWRRLVDPNGLDWETLANIEKLTEESRLPGCEPRGL